VLVSHGARSNRAAAAAAAAATNTHTHTTTPAPHTRPHQPTPSCHQLASTQRSRAPDAARAANTHLARQRGEDALRVDEGRVAEVVQAAVLEDLGAGLEPHGLAEGHAVLGQQLGGDAAQGAWCCAWRAGRGEGGGRQRGSVAARRRVQQQASKPARVQHTRDPCAPPASCGVVCGGHTGPGAAPKQPASQPAGAANTHNPRPRNQPVTHPAWPSARG
jgi:hypothetical protein